MFRGGFRREAAAAVADATLPTLPTLAALSAKSLLRFEADGRYHLHELLRQFAWDLPRSRPDEFAAVEARHADHFLRFLAVQGDLVSTGQQRQALAAIGDDLENIRQPWQIAVDRPDAPELPVTVRAISSFYHLRGRFHEGIAALALAVDRLRNASPGTVADQALAAAENGLGLVLIRVGRLAEARAALDSARTRCDRLGGTLPRGLASDSRVGLDVLALVDADDAAAERLGEAVCERADAEGNLANLPYGWYLRTQAAFGMGDLAAADAAAHAAHAAVIRSRDDWFLANCFNDLGVVALARGRPAEARSRFEAAFSLREEFADAEGMAAALAHLGEVALTEMAYDEARARFTRSSAIYEEIGDRGGLARALHGLGRAVVGSDDLRAAGEHLAAALRVATDISFIPLTLSVAVDAADLLLRRGQLEPAVVALAVARDHPLTDGDARKRAEALLARIGPGAISPSNRERAHRDDLEATIAALVAALPIPDPTASPSLSPDPVAQPSPSPLPDPLTERELDVLRLIAAGRSNRQVADELFLTVSTVKWYAGQIFGKLGAANRAEAVAKARDFALIP